ncbi:MULTISPECIES: CaiB/BaiF CoA transferase family protein [Ramlibacter]|uniref:CoA transferase n=1 Tax=Ramlibacter pinisoli TaxID=2682844 RepID=A0A6N8IYD3_9BURK|nr:MULTISPECIES: CaiB/BaiF CoA-transferase family protein [Ramlibacter]MBA2961021.1 CoA transferase [Ramlibacter sp. CGMCC 1.13660]MVQ30966.1 CoA transferase [Ramlibacter pinisoli]
MNLNQDDTALPLAGLTVLDFSQFLAGPSCALRMADLGADVIKVERPDGGDLCRQLVLADQKVGGDSALFHTINRNKRSFAADLKDPADLEHVTALVARADVMIHNFRPGVMERLGLDFAAVQQLNPRMVYAAVTGYGEAGPWRGKPGQDLLVQSLSGMAWLSGQGGDDAPPVPAGLSVVDMMTGAHLLQGILALLVRRGITGRGGRVDASLLETALDLQFEPFTAFLNGDGEAPRRSRVNHANVHAAAPYGIYRTADGFLALAMAPMDELARLVESPRLAELAADRASWYRERDTLKQALQDHLRSRSTQHWLAQLEPAGIWCADVLTWSRLLEHPGFAVLDMVQPLSGRAAGMKTTRCPLRIDRQVLRSPRPAPAIGEHTQEILRELGLGPAREGSVA